MVIAQHEPVLSRDVGEGLGQLGVDEQDPRAGVLDDVAHLVGAEPEVHRHQDAPEPTHPEEGREQPRAVVADDGYPVADPDAQLIEPRRLPSGEGSYVGVGQLAQRWRRLVRLVHDPDASSVDLDGSIDEVRNAERDVHDASWSGLCGHVHPRTIGRFQQRGDRSRRPDQDPT
jgi:hypothetical protein